MAIVNFPSSPSLNQTYTENGRTWRYNGTGWVVVADPNVAPLASPAFTGNPTAPTPAAGDNDTSIATTAFVQSALSQSGPLAGFRNAIINGNFDIWQRGSTFNNVTPPGPDHYDYCADRWVEYGFRTGGSSRTYSSTRQAFTAGQTDVPGEPTYFYRHQETAAGSGYDYKILYQFIENVRTFAGQQVTVSFYAKAASSLTLPNVGWQQYFGASGSSQVAGSFATNINITTAWQKFTYTTTIDSVSGKTITDDDVNFNSVGLRFDLPLTVTFTLDLAQVQLELGPVATPFERRPKATELALCQRYHFKTVGGDLIQRRFNYSASTSTVFLDFTLPVPPRADVGASLIATLDVQDGGSVGADVLWHRGTEVYIAMNGIPSAQFVDLNSITMDCEL